MLKARLYDGSTPVPDQATLILSGPMARLVSRRIDNQYPAGQLRVSPRIGQAERFILFPDGLQLQCPDADMLGRLPQEGATEGLVAWLEQRWWVALTSLTLLISGLLAGYFVGLPLAAEHISANIPIEYERTIGEQSLVWLDENKVFLPSKITPEGRQAIDEGFARLHAGLPLDGHYRLEFRSSPAIGPNALALPGGIVVITDEMIQKADSLGEALAVLAHEIGHVERRHALRSVMQNSVVAVLAATLTSDASSLSLVVAGLPAVLAQTKYSREFESEADEFAFWLLKQNELSPELFASMMERLAEDDRGKARLWSFVSSHPVTAERIARARKAAEN
ncbi:MAG: M48 family metallopeptidase [Sulfuricaulis sp.]|nr:M48 family metallopeptidase [Sulfuricaulis sp.]